MNKSLRPLTVMLVLLIFSLGFSFKIPVQEVKATYVWGPIDRDTVWTLVDSPFIVSNDIIVYSSATLTIESAVEVRFGGNFTLVVEGSLVARGTEAANIKFTSDSLNPMPGDWGTILLNGTGSFAWLSNCTVEYGTSGITVGSGSLNLEDCQVRSNSENGIAVANGTVEASNNSIESNAESGVLVEGNNLVSIHNNNLTLNGDGIRMTGNFTSQADIEQNTFFNNTNSGISLEAENFDTTLIVDNTFSNNYYGFYVATSASTNITNNHILNNTFGIFYEGGTAHQAHFNDIYDNKMGLDVSDTAGGDANYNYWGDQSGPEHDALNPYGKGNPVGGNGTNLSFIFFLTHPFEYNNSPPTATLQTDKTLVAPNQNVTLMGTNSDDDGQVDQYFFDFGDGNNTGWTTLSMFNYSYTSPGTYTLSLNVKDDFNVTSQNPATTSVTVQDNLTPLDVAIALSNETVNLNANVSATVFVSSEYGPVSNANIRLQAVRDRTFTPILGMTDSNGYFRTVFTAPNVTHPSNVRIIAMASMSGFADGSDYVYLRVLPPLNVQIIPDLTTVNSEDNVTIRVNVTDSLEQPVSDAYLILSVDNGTLSASSGMADTEGTAAFTFAAPATLTQINSTITVTANKTEYASGQSQQIIMVEPRLLALTVSAQPTRILSEETSTITIHVAYGSAPVQGATLALSSDIGGNFSATTNTTDSNGNATFIFIAPQVTVPEATVATITINAIKTGYVNAEEQTAIAITPRILILNVTAQPDSLTSEANANITVACLFDQNPVPQANVTVISENGGNFSVTTALTDQNGNAVFPFTAPPADSPFNVTISATASKIGYADGDALLPIAVRPGNLTVQVKPSSQGIMSTETSVIVIYVSSNAGDTANATVTVSSNYGNFSATSRLTDPSGRCTFTFYAPKTTFQLSALINVTVAKYGYIGAVNQTAITVFPETTTNGGGWPLTTILIILIPLMIVVIVLALIKLKVISISFKEEE